MSQSLNGTGRVPGKQSPIVQKAVPRVTVDPEVAREKESATQLLKCAQRLQLKDLMGRAE